MLSSMREIGLVVLDLFPFAFNADTCCQYGSLSESKRIHLVQSCSTWYLKPKLSEIFKRSKGNPTFGVRYTRLYSFASKIIQASSPQGEKTKIELACKRIANAPLDLEKMADHLK